MKQIFSKRFRSGYLLLCTLIRDGVEIFNLRQTSLLGAAAAATPLLGVLFLPVLLRQYSPQAFGEYALVLSAGSVLASVATLRLELVIPALRYTSQAKRLARALIVASGLVCIIFPVLGFFLFKISGRMPQFHGSALALYGIITAIALPLCAFAIFKGWLVRIQAAKAVAVMHFVRPIVFVILALGFAMAQPETDRQNGIFLLIAAAVSWWVAALAGISFSRQVDNVFNQPLQLRRTFRELKANSAFFSGISTSQALAALSIMVPLWGAGLLFDAKAAGWVAFARTAVMFPSMIAGLPLELILKPRFRFAYHNRQAFGSTVSIVLILVSIVGLAGFSLLAAISPWVTDGLIGADWLGASSILQLFCLYGFAYFIGTTARFVPTLFKKSRYLVWFNTARLACLGLCCGITYVVGLDLAGFVLLSVLVDMAAQLFNLAYAFHLVRRHDAGVDGNVTAV